MPVLPAVPVDHRATGREQAAPLGILDQATRRPVLEQRPGF